jgi:hypothetical protein
MRKLRQHGKPGSPFGEKVTQYPETPDETVEVKAPAEEPVVETEDDKALATVEENSGVSTKTVAELPTVLDFLPESTAKLISEDQKRALLGNVNSLGYWMETSMVCNDHECAFKQKCHLFKAKIPRPVGEDCPVELAQSHAYKMMLTGSLSVEDQQDPFLIIQINDLVHIMMIEARAYGQFGIDGGVIEVDDVRGFNPISGEHVVAKVVHRAIAILEKTGKRKERLLAKLLATPQDRAKADRDGVHDRSRKAAEIGARIAKVAKQRKGEMQKGGREVFVVERHVVEEADVTEVIDMPKD